jgi:AAA family ATP:ADP antiporter
MLGAAGLLAVCMVLTNLVNLREKRRRGAAQAQGAPAAADEKKAAAEAPVTGRSGFALVFSDRYLLLIAGLMLIYNLVNTNGEYLLGRTVVSLYAAAHGAAAQGGLDEKKVIGEFYGNFFTIVNIISAVIQALVVSRVIKYFGIRIALLVLPVVALGGYLAMALVPFIAVIRSVKIAENSIDYSLQNTTRNALYLPTSREAMYKAKQANDTFFVRFGDLLSAGLVFAGTTWLGFATRTFAYVNVGLVLVWIVLAIAIGRRFNQMTKDSKVT